MLSTTVPHLLDQPFVDDEEDKTYYPDSESNSESSEEEALSEDETL